MCVCEVVDVTNVYGGLNGWDGGWDCLAYVLSGMLCIMCVIIVWGGDCRLVIILMF